MSQLIRLDQVAELNPPLPDSLPDDAPVSFLPMSAIIADSASATPDEERAYRDVRKGYTPFLDGDVLVAKITPCFENGKIAQVQQRHRVGFGSTEFHVVRARQGVSDARYLVHFLRQEHIRREGERRMTGSAGQRRVPAHFIAGLPVALHSIEEQRRIASILDRADAVRRKRRAALAQLDTLTESIFVDMFGDPISDAGRWRRTTIKDASKLVQIGPFGSLLHQEDYISGGIPLVNPIHIVRGRIRTDPRQSISPEKYSELALYHLMQGDVIMGRRGEMGRCAIVGSEHAGLVCGTGSLIVRPDSSQTTSMYLYATLSSQSMRRRLERFSLGATLPNLNRTIIENLVISVPPLSLQREFAHRVAAVEKLKATQRTALGELDALFASLQHRAFRGELQIK